MSVLLIIKPSNYDLHHRNVMEAISRGLLPQAEISALKQEHEEHYSSIKLFKSLLDKNKIPFTAINRFDAWPAGKSFDFVFTLGGDGTLLGAAKNLDPQIPIAGVCSTNTSVGFLCSVKFDKIPQLIDDYLQKKLPIKEFSRLGIKIQTFDDRKLDKVQPIVNDVLFSASQPAATARYLLTYNGVREEHKSSGIWVSTAVGSNAAVLAAGGKVLDPLSAMSEFCVREPYGGAGAYKLNNEVFDISKDSLKILVKMVGAKLYLDGTQEEINLEYGDQIEFFQSVPLKIVRYD